MKATQTDHMDVRAALDYLESKMDAKGRRAVEEHLGHPCGACRELIREVGWLVERMRLDRGCEVTEALHALALGVFQPQPRPVDLSRAARGRVHLQFDSWQLPRPIAVLRAVGELRRLRFSLGSDALELESEMESADTRTIRGRLEAPDPALHRIDVVVGKERLTTRPSADGAFVLDGIPLGPARITVTGPRNRYQIPPLA